MNLLKLIINFFLTLFLYNAVYSEGTKPLQSSDSCENRIQIMPYFSPFAMYNCAPEHKLYISIADTNEIIYIGFGNIYDYSGNLKNDVVFRIISPSGQVVYGPDTIPSNGIGFINNYTEAIAGPVNVTPQGYNPIVIHPIEIGDYYIEFDMPKYPNWLVIKQPEERFFNIGLASFGPAFADSLICSEIVYIPDSSSLFTGCNGYEPNSLLGKIALIDRGLCYFTTKVLKAQQAGAVAAIIVNNVPYGGVISMGIADSAEAQQITIPSAFISYEDGIIIKQWLNSNYTVFSCFGDSSYGYERRIFEYFDITITDNDNNIKNGRIWSKAWQFTTLPYFGNADPFADPFFGKVYVYNTKDSVVTSFDFNGMRPFVFVMSANSSGCFNTGDIINDRKSAFGLHTLPEFKVFLNIPDTTIFKISETGKIVDSIFISGCYPGPYCININVTKQGLIHLYFDLDSVAGYQEGGSDVKITKFVSPGFNCILWDGKDNYGNEIASDFTFNLKLEYFNCETHTPLYDVEANPNGFKINLVYPYDSLYNPLQFWDDSNIPNGTSELNGCNSAEILCHTWLDTISCSGNIPCSLGDLKTINTWWYAGKIDTTLKTSLNLLSVSALVKNVSCNGNNDGAISLIINGGIAPYTVSWNDSIVDPINLGPGTYYYTVTDAQNCSISGSVEIIEPLPLIATIDSIKHIQCYGDSSGKVYVSAQGGTIPYTFILNPLGLTSQSGNFANLSEGNYVIVVNDANNCKDSVSITITSPPDIIVIFDSIIFTKCYGDTNAAIYVSAWGGTLPLTFLWNDSINSEDIIDIPAGIYNLTIYDANNCEKHFSINIPQVPILSVIVDSIIHLQCNNDKGAIYTTTSGGTPPYEYFWSESVSSNNNALNLLPGIYSLTVIDSNRCISQLNNIEVKQLYKETIDIFSQTAKSCKGQCTGKANLFIVGDYPPFNVMWSTGENSYTIENLCTGYYKAVVIDSKNCKDSALIFIDEYLTAPSVDRINIKDATCPGVCNGQIIISASGGIKPYTFYLNTVEIDTIETNVCGGQYILGIKDMVGCVFTDTIKVNDFFLDENEIPNIITPNNDGYNDIFIYNSNCEIPLQFYVFNRWGAIIYYLEAVTLTWDGYSSAGVKVSPGTYFYLIKGTGKYYNIEKTGYITVLYEK
ncbi:MAG: gliding motility-associated C-terminal domain-containing protein [Bacteroidales bacterium]|nr:gliding motility-associated C-terminal domain-containing protein [Bacteroidales bacterium]